MTRLSQLKKIKPQSKAEAKNLHLAIRQEKTRGVFAKIKSVRPPKINTKGTGSRRRSELKKTNTKKTSKFIKKQLGSSKRKNTTPRATPKYYNKQEIL